MHRKIAMCTAPTGDLNLVYLDNNGNPWTFRQTADGVWHPSKAEGGAPIQIPVQGQTTFQAVLGLNGLGLVALDSTGALRFTTQNANIWNAGGFALLPNTGLKFSDYDWSNVQGLPVLLLGIGAAGGVPSANANYDAYSQYGILAGMSQPTLIPNSTGMAVSATSTNVISAGQATSTAIVGLISALALGASSGPVILSTVDGVNWNQASVQAYPYPDLNPPPAFRPVSLVLVAGNPAQTLQAIALNSSYDGNLYLWNDTSGAGTNWQFYGPLPNPDSLKFSAVAAGMGADGHLQVIGLAGGLPYLIWQDSRGKWSQYENPGGQGMQLPFNSKTAAPLQDLVTGIGNQGYFQVGYIGADGQIYVNWQDPNGNWGWYGPLP